MHRSEGHLHREPNQGLGPDPANRVVIGDRKLIDPALSDQHSSRPHDCCKLVSLSLPRATPPRSAALSRSLDPLLLLSLAPLFSHPPLPLFDFVFFPRLSSLSARSFVLVLVRACPGVSRGKPLTQLGCLCMSSLAVVLLRCGWLSLSGRSPSRACQHMSRTLNTCEHM